MRTFNVPERRELKQQSQDILNKVEKDIGKVPNVYTMIGYSPESLESFMNFSNHLEHTAFDRKQIEAIKLLTSQVNECDYCISAHNAIGKNLGFTENELMDIRRNDHSDPKWKALLQLTWNMVKNRGEVDPTIMEEFFNQGFTKRHFIDMISVITETTFTNYLNKAVKTPIDFPKVEELSEVELA